MAELLEAFPVRAALETLAARLAAVRMGDDALGELRALLDAMQAAAAAGDAHEQSQADAAFHAAIVRGAGQRDARAPVVLPRALPADLRHRVARGHRPGHLADSHRPVLEALAARDPEAAAAALHAHLMDAASVLEAHAGDD